MPFIRVNCPRGSLSPAQKTQLAPRLVQALIRQEIDPVTDIGTAATGFFYNEVDVENCFPGGMALSEHPEKVFWTVEAFVAASYFTQKRRDEMQRDIAKAFVDILGDDGTVMQQLPSGISMMTTCRRIRYASQGPDRLTEALELGKRMKEARLS